MGFNFRRENGGIMISNESGNRTINAHFNPIKHALREGKVCVGVAGLSFPCPASVQITANAGYSFYYFDMEHSGLSISAIEHICTAAKIAGITPIGGSSGIADYLISRLLDNGAMGVIAPHVNTQQETQIVVNACRYPPKGTRGFVGLGALTDYQTIDAVKWVEEMNEEILCAVKVESAQGVDNIERITDVSGLDAVIIGTADLSVSMGIPGQSHNPRFQKAIDTLLNVCSKKNIACGPHVNNPEDLKYWADKGANFMTCSFDGQLLLEASKSIMETARKLLGNKMYNT